MEKNAGKTYYDKMTLTPVPRLITRLALPTTASMLVTAIYNMADTFFVSQIGQSASGAVGVVFTLMLLIQAIGFTLGMGAGSNIARLLGDRDAETAGKVASTAFFISLFLGALLSVAALLNLDGLVRLLGATETIAPHAKAYAGYILLGAPYMATAFVLNNILRSQGNAFYSMIGITAGGLLNIALDPIFIFVLDMGTGGAALATIISQLVSFTILLVMVMRHGAARIQIKKIDLKILGRILPTGAPSFYRQGMTSVATILLNRAAGVYGDAAVAAMSIVSRIMGFSFSALIGFCQGYQPVCGFNYGARLYGRVRESLLFTMRVTTIGMTALGALAFLFAPTLMGFFRPGDTEVIEIGMRALRYQALLMPTLGFSVLTNMSMQALGKSAKASLLAITRQGLFFIPAILLLQPLLGLLGVQLAQPLADLLSLGLSIPFGMGLLRELKERSLGI